MDGTSRRSRHLRRWGFVLCAFVVVVVCATSVALAACGGESASSGTRSSAPSMAATTDRPSPVATPTTTAQVAAAYFADAAAGKSTIWLYAADARFEDRASGDIVVGKPAIGRYFDYLAGFLTATARSQFVGGDALVVENVASGLYGVDVLRLRGGKIVTDYVYYSDLQPQPAMHEPALLKTAPAPSDTQAVSRRVGGAYMTALRSLSLARLASLYASDVVYQDTSRDVLYRGPSAAAAHARMFVLKGVRFQANGVLDGPGWAAVMWKRTDREGGKPLVDISSRWAKWGKRPSIHGVSILEIRDGKIARETIYSDHLRTRH